MWLDLESFVSSYQGPKLRLLFTGAGAWASGLLGVPGASSVVDSLHIPYSYDAVRSLLEKWHPNADTVLENSGAVSAEMATALHLCNCHDLGSLVPVTVTAAITTSRYRKGDNHAYIVVGHPSSFDVYHLILDKLSEQEHVQPMITTKRYVQDRVIGEVALSLACSLSHPLLSELMEGGYLVRLS